MQTNPPKTQNPQEKHIKSEARPKLFATYGNAGPRREGPRPYIDHYEKRNNNEPKLEEEPTAGSNQWAGSHLKRGWPWHQNKPYSSLTNVVREYDLCEWASVRDREKEIRAEASKSNQTINEKNKDIKKERLMAFVGCAYKIGKRKEARGVHLTKLPSFCR